MSNRKSARKNDGNSPSKGTRLIQNMLSKKLEEKFSNAIL
jgi:hypothetical protein